MEMSYTDHVQWKDKKNQGNNNSTSGRVFHSNRHTISAQPDNPLCPVNSFKVYASLLHEGERSFSQHPNKQKDAFDKEPIGKNTLGDYMKQILKAAKLSKIYTNHQIRKTTATALHRSGYNLNEVANVTKHWNLYVAGPSYEDKRGYNTALKNYAMNPQQEKRSSTTTKETEQTEQENQPEPTKKKKNRNSTKTTETKKRKST